MKKLLITLLCCLTLAGCGNSGNVVTNESSLNIGTENKIENIPENAEVLVKDFIYFDLDTGTDKKINFYLPNGYQDNDIANCLYVVMYVNDQLSQEEMEYEISIVLPDKTYVLNAQANTMENLGLPEDWTTFIKNNDIGNGKTVIQDFIAKSQADTIEKIIKEKIINAL